MWAYLALAFGIACLCCVLCVLCYLWGSHDRVQDRATAVKDAFAKGQHEERLKRIVGPWTK